MNVVLIGAGNIATSLSVTLQQQGHTISQIWSRTLASARQLAARLNDGDKIAATNQLSDIQPNADLYILAVKDGALAAMAEQLGCVLKDRHCAYSEQRLFVHVACTQSMDVLRPLRAYGMTGVLYPFQSFVRSRVVDMSKVAFFVEGDSENSLKTVRDLAHAFSPSVYEADYNQRLYLHFAGNMACNFSNCLYAIAKEVLDEAHLPFDVLLPIADESAQKIHQMSPREAQAGPAMRRDDVTIAKHLELIGKLSTPTALDPNAPFGLKDIYRFFTYNIQAASC